MVIDNANSLEDLKKNDHLLRKHYNIHILLTSRITKFQNVEVLPIKHLNEEDAKKLFVQYFENYDAKEDKLLSKILKAIEYNTKFSHHHFPSSSNFYAIYFTLTGLHGLHVIGGMIVNTYFIFPGAKMWETHPEQFTNRIECAGLYWHLVDLVWIFLFPVLYLL